MVYQKIKIIRVFIIILVVSCLCLITYNMSLTEICTFWTRKEGTVVFKKNSGNFLQLPDMDCKKNPPFLVVMVTSSHNQIKARMAIRETWGKERSVKGKRIVTYFLLGITNSKDDDVVTQESQKYRDIIQKDFLDGYFNLTLKTMMGIEWVHHFCPQSDFVMKTDSDVFVNVYYLTELLIRKNRTTRFFTGFLKMNEFPIRNIFSKWYVSKYEYPWKKYPPFCSGTGYVFSSDIASEVYNVSEEVPFIKLEDVFVGLCLAELKIELQELHSEQTFFPNRLKFSSCRFKKIVTCHFVKPVELLTYWKALERSLDEKCPAV
ncbi:beta-1,3-galactosyltransferase 5-like [Phascolarctos cinereus]|uniref:Hexosyltransferase n=1 Tax=Phascolarctos cinereus TaxID=38626 RepID=A0A6P5KYU9_PHACI|nr:beta-1,3-galactosyltransferase 5-like [Phascolarctos cinereus]XP_020848567.1 beta-1,3-galactosyltransferase 5-like [Phascolarctos cinereus]XP_020848568.1 beta-1,3-galactosyltransferase 5-like [Phascolarctos cinereus]XP_020848569.1 beta-1,3-galactosyltransferase 5-like [Phascolarctos cinereus]XP_020848570.1 beta-1,3-galactosyltransferase 5-like [Phascolarctos cinereus]XP_020848571.1 beta-1,3-galactosyltransferase 5-like [Phascolarctos cinereus]XP_020848572.1 beta-1,3-galactosyltransferase 5